MKNRHRKGLFMIFTGEGKGKTTAALGQAFRAMGHQYKVCVIQFIKGSWKYGELFAKERFEDLLDFHVMGRGFTFKSENLEIDKQLAQEGWELAKAAMANEEYFLVILDEMTYLLQYGFVDAADVLNTIQQRPEALHVILTGRNAPRNFLDAADLVSEMMAVKHPFASGIKAQQGIEF